jgi:hypothetical protein
VEEGVLGIRAVHYFFLASPPAVLQGGGTGKKIKLSRRLALGMGPRIKYWGPSKWKRVFCLVIKN